MRTKKFKFILPACAVLLFFIASSFGVTRTVGGWAAGALAPIGRALMSLVPERGAGSAKRVQVLENEVARLLVENVRLKGERRSSQEDAGLTTWLAQRALRGEVAHVIGQTPESGDRMIVIDRGTEKQIQTGAPVLMADGVLLGIVSAVRPYRSTILPVTSPRSLVAAVVDNGRNTPGLLRGEHGLTMTMESIPQNEHIENGQAVVTSNLNEHIPENLLLGTIQNVTTSIGDVFQQAAVLPILDHQRARSVVVITGDR